MEASHNTIRYLRSHAVNFHTSTRLATILLITAATFVVAGCGSNSSGATTGADSPKPQNLVFSLDYVVDGLHAPFFVAQAKHYYNTSGLHVTIEPSGGSSISLARVTAGKADLGVVGADKALAAIAQGDSDIEVVGILTAHSPVALMTLRSSGITKPSQLKGKTIAGSSSGSTFELLPGFLKASGLGSNDVHLTNIASTAGDSLLIAGKVNALVGLAQTAATLPFNVIPWYKYGFDEYGSAIVANKQYLAKHPNAVKAFLAASFRGLAATVKDPAAAGQIVATAGTASAKYYTAEIEILKPFWTTMSGRMTNAQWTKTQQYNLQYETQKTSLPLQQVYTNNYLPSS